MREVRQQRLTPFVLINVGANVAVEVAVGAFADAERPMDVERQSIFGAPNVPNVRSDGDVFGVRFRQTQARSGHGVNGYRKSPA